MTIAVGVIAVDLRIVWIAVLIALASLTGCGGAAQVGRGAAQGAMGVLAEKAEQSEGFKRRTVSVMLDELGQPRNLEDVQRIAAAMAVGVVVGASGDPWMGSPRADVRTTVEREPRAVRPVEVLTEQAARSLSAQLVAQLGRDGEGPLTSSLSATSAQVAASVAQQAASEAAALFPECDGADAATCLDAAMARVGRAGSAGVVSGVRESLGAALHIITFSLGAMVALVVASAWKILSSDSPRPSRRRLRPAARRAFNSSRGGFAGPERK